MEYWHLILIFVILKALSSLLKKKQEDPDKAAPRPPKGKIVPLPGRPEAPSPTAPRPARTFDWEAELRRLLEGEPEETPRPEPPPVVVVKPRIPAPAPVATPPTPPVATPPVLQPVSLPKPVLAPAPTVVVARPLLTVADTAIERARQLPGQVSEHLQQVAELTPTAPPASPRVQRSAAPEILAQLRQPKGAREAFIASLVFGPPPSLEG